jgi:hypothetical protein
VSSCFTSTANSVCTDTVCSCGVEMDPTELALVWQKRALPIMVRLMRHGHMVDRSRINKTMELLLGIERGSVNSPESYELTASSHHLPPCTWRKRFRSA